MEAHRAAWLTLGGLMVGAALVAPATVWAVTAATPTVTVPLWLFIFPTVTGVAGRPGI